MATSRTTTMTYNGLYTYIETEIELAAPPEQAWTVFADFAGWGRWSSGFMTFLEPPAAVGKRCGLVCQLSQGAMKTSTHWPMVRRRRLRGEGGGVSRARSAGACNS